MRAINKIYTYFHCYIFLQINSNVARKAHWQKSSSDDVIFPVDNIFTHEIQDSSTPTKVCRRQRTLYYKIKFISSHPEIILTNQ